MGTDVSFHWMDFKDNIAKFTKKTRDHANFSDVTLVCEDKFSIKANMFVLSASSPFFEDILCMIQHPNPVIYLRGVEKNILNTLVTFIYSGEVTINHQDLQRFLSLGEDLEVKGLLESLHGKQGNKKNADVNYKEYDNIEDGEGDNGEDEEDDSVKEDFNTDIGSSIKIEKLDTSKTRVVYETFPETEMKDNLIVPTGILDNGVDNNVKNFPNYWTKIKKGDPGSKQKGHTRFGEYYNKCNIDDLIVGPTAKLLEKHWRKHHSENPCDKKMSVTDDIREEVIGSLIVESSDGQFQCKMCGVIKTNRRRSELYRHVESNHITGGYLRCQICSKHKITQSAKVGRPNSVEFKTRYGLDCHMRETHKITKQRQTKDNHKN